MSALDNRKESFGIGAWNVDFHEPAPRAVGAKKVTQRKVELLYLGGWFSNRMAASPSRMRKS